MTLPLPWPAALVQAPKAPKTLELQAAESLLLEAFDEGAPLPSPRVAARDRAALAWLRQAASGLPTRNPFPPGTPSHREAEALLAFLQGPAPSGTPDLGNLKVSLNGTRLALWQWGRKEVRAGRMDPPSRKAWEDRLLGGGHPVLRGLALRHALCWALAENDEARFGELKGGAEPETLPFFTAFQNLFGWIGGTSPSLRLWNLPGLEYGDLRLDQLEGRRIWIAPMEPVLPQLPEQTAWIIPAKAGETAASEPNPSPVDAQEARDLAARLQTGGLKAWFAPQRRLWENLGLSYFPVLVELDEARRIVRIRMGDAAPENP